RSERDWSSDVCSSDLTKLAGPPKGVYYNADVMLDIFSRFIVGCVVHARETAGLAEDFMATVFGVYGIPKVVHADRGSSMTSKPEIGRASCRERAGDAG